VTDDRHLMLLRHAKSSWDDASCPDHDRPLTARGRRGAELVGRHLRELKTRPTLVLCSSARRARETLEGIAPALGDEVEVLVERELYGATGGQLLDRLRQVPRHTSSVMAIGHNPGLEDLATTLAGGGDTDALDRMARKFPTAALATFEVPGTWRQLAPGTATLVAYVVPRELE
jgi:phosphohistidine phosphatase